MVDIFSKNSAPRREDQEARDLINRNRGTITKLADRLSNGAYSQSQNARRAPKTPEPSGLIISDLGAARPLDDPEPYVRISPNRRVVIADAATSRQMHHLGEIRRGDGRDRFVLATKANGFFSPLDPEIAERLEALDGIAIDDDLTEDALAARIGESLGLD